MKEDIIFQRRNRLKNHFVNTSNVLLWCYDPLSDAARRLYQLLDGFDYVPLWDGREERVDMRLRSSMPQRVRIADLDLDIQFGEGDEIRVEISTKFRRDRLADELQDAGFELAQFWNDDNNDFGLALARRS